MSCEHDNDCKDHEYCNEDETGVCIEGCRNDESCKSNQFCDYSSSKCTVGCRHDQSCNYEEHCDYLTKKCSKGCLSDVSCLDDEFCDLDSQKCQKICNNSACGQNGKCLASSHTKFCSCINGFTPVSGIGCLVSTESTNVTCESACGVNNHCTTKDGRIYCSCSDEHKINPIIDQCSLPLLVLETNIKNPNICRRNKTKTRKRRSPLSCGSAENLGGK